MNKKLYISPEFEWLSIDIVEDVLSVSMPDINTDEDIVDEDDLFGDLDSGVSGDGGGTGGSGEDSGDDWLDW